MIWVKPAYLQPVFKKLITHVMARVCQITGKKTRVGNNVSHANNKTKRKFYPNLQTKRFFVPSLNEWVTLKLSTTAIRTISKKGIEAVLKETGMDITKLVK